MHVYCFLLPLFLNTCMNSKCHFEAYSFSYAGALGSNSSCIIFIRRLPILRVRTQALFLILDYQNISRWTVSIADEWDYVVVVKPYHIYMFYQNKITCLPNIYLATPYFFPCPSFALIVHLPVHIPCWIFPCIPS